MTQDCIQIYNEAYYRFTGTNGYPLDYSKAFELFEQAAALGSSNAMNYLGLIYEEGKGAVRNPELAFYWYEKAVQTEQNPYALYNLGRLYYNGIGVSKNLDKAYEFCKASADLGIGNTHKVYAKACYITGCILLERFGAHKESYPYFSEAAKYGNIPGAWHNLGWLTEKGIRGQNSRGSKESEALGFYEMAGELGYLPSLDDAGRLAFVLGDVEKARQLLKNAASQGYEPAKKRLKMVNASKGSIWDLFR